MTPARLFTPFVLAAAASAALSASAQAAISGTVDVRRTGTTLHISGAISGAARGVDWWNEGNPNLLGVYSDADVRSSDGSCVVSANKRQATCTIPGSGSTGFTAIAADFSQSTADIDLGPFVIGPASAGGSTGGAPSDGLPLTAIMGSGDDTVAAHGPATIDGGGGDDRISGSGAADVIDGAGGDDSIDGNGGDDVVDGGANGPLGDTIDYGNRIAPVTVSLPTTTATVPSGTGGEAGEHDTMLRVENVIGGAGADTLTGNDGPNRITGGSGADTIGGGPGDDTIEARRRFEFSTSFAEGNGEPFVNYAPSRPPNPSDPDTALSCGAGNDTIRVDLDDPSVADCERTAPGVVQPTILGTPNVGEELSLSPLQTYGDVGTVTVQWHSTGGAWDQAAGRRTPVASGAKFVIPDGELGESIYARVTVTNGNDSFSAFSAPVGKIGARLPAKAGTTASGATATAGGTPAGSETRAQAPASTFASRIPGLVAAVLGTDGKALGPVARNGCAVYRPTPAPKRFRYGTSAITPFAVACDRATRASVRWRVRLTSGKGAPVTISGSRIALAQEGVAPVHLELTRAQRRVIRSAGGATVTMTLSFVTAREVTRTVVSSTFRLSS